MKFRNWLYGGFQLLFCLVSPVLLVAEQLAFHEPRVCTGRMGGEYRIVQQRNCASHFAFFAQSARPGGTPTFAPGSKVAVSGSCCPLPAEDILLESEKKSIQGETCPQGYVVTGGRDKTCEDCDYTLVCTKINTRRYQLAASEAGVAWGVSSSDWKVAERIDRADLPLAIRYGIGRTSRWRFAKSGCVGRTPGSLFVGRTSKHCKDYLFRQLQFAGSAGDPPKGTPVRMFPVCDLLSDPLLEEVRCIRF